MDLHDDLDAYVLGDDDMDLDADETIPPPRDAEHANRLLRVVRGLDREAEEIERVARDEMRRIESWRDDRLTGLVKRRAAVANVLADYVRALNRENPKRKTVKFPNGTLALRAPRASVDVTDRAKFDTWWRENVRSEVAQYVRDVLDVDDVDESKIAEIVELVLSRSPLVSVKVEPSKSGLAQLAKGPAIGDDVPDAHALLVDGEPVPGVALVQPTVDAFSLTVTR